MKNLFKFLLLGAFTLSLGVGFVGCKNYDDEIDEICERLDNLQEIVDGFGGGRYVTNVTETDTDITFTFNEGTPATVVVAKAAGNTGGDEHPVKISGSLTDGFTLSVWDGTKYVDVAVPTATSLTANAVKDIVVLGNITDFDPEADAFAIGDAVTTVLDVDYAWIQNFSVEPVTGVAATSGTAAASTTYGPWPGGAMSVAKGSVLNTLKAAGTGLVVEVTPSNADFRSFGELTLVDNKGNILPVKLQTPVRIDAEATLTRATSTSTSALYFIPMTYTNATYADAAGLASGYTGLFGATGAGTDTAFWLEAGGVRYGQHLPFTVTATAFAPSTSEAAVASLVDSDDTAAAGTGVDLDNAWGLYRNKPYTATFAAASNVVDYYFTIVNPTVNTTLFGAQLSNNNQTITLTKIPDPVTAAGFKIGVYKLMVDGNIFYQESWVSPLRNDVDAPYALGDYVINDNVPTNASDYLSQPMKTIDLAAMFASMNGEEYSEGVSLETYWKGNDGAADFSVEITATNADGDDDTTAATALTPEDNVVDADFATSTHVKFYKDAALATAATNLYDARYMVITPSYSPDGSAASFVPYDEYTVVFTFEDAAGNELNTITVTFTPVLPNVADLIVKNIAGKFWSADASTLLAYYPEPTSWATTSVAANYNINPATGNGGFISIGGTSGTDKQWADPFVFAIDDEQEFGANETLMTDVAGYDAATTMFGLFYQNDVDDAAPQTDSTVSENADDDTRVGLPADTDDPYKTPISVLVDATGSKYLGIAAYTWSDDAAETFKIQMMSALYEGTISAVGGTIELEAVGDEPATIDNSMIKATKYNANVPYDIFTYFDSAAAYKYTYISSVSFKVADTSFQNLELVGKDDAGTNLASSTAQVYEFPATAADDPDTTDVNEAAGYIQIRAINSPSGLVEGEIEVTVNDRFGKTKTATLPVTIDVTVAP